MAKAWLNALFEIGTRHDLICTVMDLEHQNDQLRADKRRLDEENAKMREALQKVI